MWQARARGERTLPRVLASVVGRGREAMKKISAPDVITVTAKHSGHTPNTITITQELYDRALYPRASFGSPSRRPVKVAESKAARRMRRNSNRGIYVPLRYRK